MKKVTVVFFILLATSNATRTKEYATLLATGCNTVLQHHVASATCATKAVALPENKGVALLHSEKYTARFADSLKAVATRLGFEPNWMLHVMHAESRLQPSATNSIGATGLIQFMPATAIDLGTTAARIAKMSATEQLPYVERFYRPIKGKIKSAAELRLYTFFPAALGKPDSFVLKTDRLPAQTVASRNAAFDLDGDMQITKGEFLKAIRP